MTTLTESTEQREGTPLKSVKALNAALSPGESVPGLLSDIWALRKRLDALLGASLQKRRLKNIEDAAKEAQKKEADRPAPPPPPEKKTASILPVATDDIVPRREAVQGKQTAQADPSRRQGDQRPLRERERDRDRGRDRDRDRQASRDPKDAARPPRDQRDAARSPRGMERDRDRDAARASRDREQLNKDIIKSPLLKTYTPSYIRGEVTPPPPRSAAPYQIGAKPPYPPRSGAGSGQDRGFGQRPGRPGEFRPGAPGAPGIQRPYPPGSGGRPFPSRPGLPLRGGGGRIVPTAPPPIDKRKTTKKKEAPRGDSPKTLDRRTLLRKGYITENLDEDRMGSRKLKSKKIRLASFVAPKVEKAIVTTPNLTVKILSEKIGKTAQEIIKQLMVLGFLTNINSVVDFPTMELVANELGVGLELKLEQTKEELLEEQFEVVDEEQDLVKRPPIVTVMGHVDHGKTSLLDAIRKTNVASGEAGGITQHIGAYSVSANGEKITFLDTPGHEAFTELRRRGANVTDIAVLIVAADDGVMPQTIEALSHAKAAKVPILVAINKIDKPAADVEKIKQELTAYEVIPEEWGGDTIMVPISAKRGDNIDKLLEMILFLAEYHNYRANPDRKAKASVVEAKLDRGKGPVANIIVQNGTLRVGDFLVSGMTSGRVRAMVDDKGRSIKEAPPSTPVSILGLESVPQSGDGAYVVDDERTARAIIDERNIRERQQKIIEPPKPKAFDPLQPKEKKEFKIILKADVHGSAEALKLNLGKMINDEVKANVIHCGVGAINKSDVMLAETYHAVIIGFNVRPDADSKAQAEKESVNIKLYNIIYEAINDVERMMKGMMTPKFREVIVGRAQVRNVFKLTDAGMVAGCYITSGKAQRGAHAKVLREGKEVHTGSVVGLKRFKEDVKEVATGFECGISVGGYDDIKEFDEIEFSIQEEIKV
ncbi:MAG: translation initiation factor IF-2 [Firmicutes bacterium]|nr:translation initiation factor IF-2 [Bacillota bacterium]